MQTRLTSFQEAIVNTGIGFTISLFTQTAITELYQTNLTFGQDVSVTLIFTVVSLGRGYIVRRVFNNREK